MVRISIMVKLILPSMLAALFRYCQADISFSSEMDLAWSCELRADNSTTATFKTNLNTLLKTLKEKGPENDGFYVNTTGETSGKMYGLLQCMGNISAHDCAVCLNSTIIWAQENCKNSNDVAIWFKRCFLRYSNGNFLGQWNTSTPVLLYNSNSSTDIPSVAVTGQNFLHNLSSDVPNQPLLFKTGSVDIGKAGTRYGQVQCNRDLNESSCSYCIEDMLEYYFQHIDNRSSYMVVSYGCRMWYDNYKFYINGTVQSTGPNGSGDAPVPSDSGMQLQISFAATVAALISVLVTILAL